MPNASYSCPLYASLILNTITMKALNNLFILFILLTLITSCEKQDNVGQVTFGANYHVINCITTVDIYIDEQYLGQLQNFTNEITKCDQPENLSKKLSTGDHSYKIEIRPLQGVGCTKDILGEFSLSKNECYIVFVDYFKIDWD